MTGCMIRSIISSMETLQTLRLKLHGPVSELGSSAMLMEGDTVAFIDGHGRLQIRRVVDDKSMYATEVPYYVVLDDGETYHTSLLYFLYTEILADD